MSCSVMPPELVLSIVVGTVIAVGITVLKLLEKWYPIKMKRPTGEVERLTIIHE